jgi:hypothetical protein
VYGIVSGRIADVNMVIRVPHGGIGFLFIKKKSPLFNQLVQLRTSSHLQLQPGQNKAKQCNKNNNTELHINKT